VPCPCQDRWRSKWMFASKIMGKNEDWFFFCCEKQQLKKISFNFPPFIHIYLIIIILINYTNSSIANLIVHISRRVEQLLISTTSKYEEIKCCISLCASNSSGLPASVGTTRSAALHSMPRPFPWLSCVFLANNPKKEWEWCRGKTVE
jgi:hypothetical protein